MQPVKDIISKMLDHMNDEHNRAGLYLAPKEDVAILVSGLGGTSLLELNIFSVGVIEMLGMEMNGHSS
jgi:dihydroxyacetone kinase